MAKENPDTKVKSETPFRKFEKLAKKLVGVPRDEAVEKPPQEKGRSS